MSGQKERLEGRIEIACPPWGGRLRHEKWDEGRFVLRDRKNNGEKNIYFGSLGQGQNWKKTLGEASHA